MREVINQTLGAIRGFRLRKLRGTLRQRTKLGASNRSFLKARSQERALIRLHRRRVDATRSAEELHRFNQGFLASRGLQGFMR